MDLLSELKLAVPWGHIAVKVWGSQKNPPVLCLHGWLDNANSFDRLIPLLPQDFCYVAMDFRGHGLSSHYNPGLPYRHQNFVSEILRVATAFKWTQFSLMGHSFGGTVGGVFACMFPEMVDKLILLDSVLLLLDSNAEKHRARAADGGLPEVPESLQPRGASAVVRAGSRGGGGGTETAVPSKSGRGCLLFLLLLFPSSHSPSSSQGHPLSPPQLASPWGGTQHQASWTLLRSFLLSPPLFSPAWGGGEGKGSSFPLKFILHLFPLSTGLRLLNNLPTVLSHSPSRAV
ncbi:serine hydrolase-like protein 2 isoform X2 [Arvicanthis niloticus]|uniref:serine hydrolase-like protein 2 isoform X2 n=1 Tax=Arvicanthis niloticus TaxID=61156 RepID=UPI00402B30A4